MASRSSRCGDGFMAGPACALDEAAGGVNPTMLAGLRTGSGASTPSRARRSSSSSTNMNSFMACCNRILVCSRGRIHLRGASGRSAAIPKVIEGVSWPLDDSCESTCRSALTQGDRSCTALLQRAARRHHHRIGRTARANPRPSRLLSACCRCVGRIFLTAARSPSWPPH